MKRSKGLKEMPGLILAAVAAFLLLAVMAAAGFLLWLQRHPIFLAKRMRGGPEVPPGVLSNPPGYEETLARVTVHKDLEYPSDLPENRFDLYLPTAAQERASLPLIVWLHGGGFIAGDKAGVANFAVLMAAEGYAVAAPNYAVAPEHPYPATVRQVNQFCAYLPKLGEAYTAIDLSHIAFAGDSAGAQIMAQTAALETNQALAREMGLPQQLSAGSLRGVLLYCGPYDLPGIRRAKSRKLRYLLSVWGRAYFGKGGWHSSAEAAQTVVSRHVTGQFPPTYITDGNRFSFEVQGRRLGEALREQGVPVRERYFPPERPVNHEYQFLLAEKEAQLAYEDTLAFLSAYVRECR